MICTARFKRLQEQAYDYLKDLLLTGKLEEGVIYSETKTAEQVGISRTPMRDALRCLEQEGYIDILPSRGFCLKPISPGKASSRTGRSAARWREYRAVMLAQEYRTVRAQEALRKMDALLARQQALAGDVSNIPQFVELDAQFHLSIVQYSRNEELERIFRNHLHYIQRMAQRSLAEPGRLAETVREHRDICDAVRFGDGLHIYAVTMQHMQNSQRMYLDGKSI